jgi:hypothetical protein
MNESLVVCPFCPLHCDDIDPSMLAQRKVSCQLANSRMHKITQLSLATGNLPDLAECREWIKSAKRIVLGGHVIDWETARAVSEFVAATGAETDGLGSDVAYTETFSREGAFLTTLGELSARETSLLVIGDPTMAWPRIDEKLSMITRRLDWSDTADLSRKLAALRRKLRDADFEITDQDVLQAYDLIQTCPYFVVLVAPDAIRDQATSPVQSHVFWSTMLGMLRELNRKVRAALLNFDHSLTVRSVLASSGTSSKAEAPPDEETLCIQIAPFGHEVNHSLQRTIVIGSYDSPPSPHVKWFPATVPGIHHPGIVIRGDGSVTLPLHTVEPSTAYPTPAEYLRALISITV